MSRDYSELKPSLLECVLPLVGQGMYYSRLDRLKQEKYGAGDEEFMDRERAGSFIVSCSNILVGTGIGAAVMEGTLYLLT